MTWEKYEAFLMHLNNFNPKLRFGDIDETMVARIKNYLANQKGRKGKLEASSIKSYFDKFKVYNISLTITITNSQFAQILDYIQLGNNAGFMYNLNSNNCSTFALNALKTGGINLPRTESSWLNGGGLNPGDLGEDIRTMTLSSNMTRSTTATYHPNQGVCY